MLLGIYSSKIFQQRIELTEKFDASFLHHPGG